jgi:hypothetical protein
MSKLHIRTDRLTLWVLAAAFALLAGTVFAGAREIRGFALTVSNPIRRWLTRAEFPDSAAANARLTDPNDYLTRVRHARAGATTAR